MTKKVNFDQILKSQVVRPIVEFGLWTVNRKSEKCVTLHSDFLEMSYELHIKMKFLVSLLLGDVKNFLIPPRTLPNLDQQICLISGYIYVKFAHI